MICAPAAAKEAATKPQTKTGRKLTTRLTAAAGFFFETMMIFIANSKTIHPNAEKSKVSPCRPHVGRRETFRPTAGQKGVFGQPLAKKAFSANRWPKRPFRPTVGHRVPLRPTPLYCFRKFISIRIFSILI